MSKKRGKQLTKYKPDFDAVFSFLNEGLQHLSNYARHLEAALTESQNEADYIANVLFPCIDKAKQEFDEMVKYAESLLQKVNKDFEKCVADLKRKDDKVEEIDIDLARLIKELERKSDAVSDADNRLENKKRELSDAQEALSSARQKLEEAKSSQKGAVIGGVATTFASLFLLPFNPPLAVAAAATGLGTELAGLTVFEEQVSACSRNVGSASDEVESSEKALQRAKDSKIKVENELFKTEDKRRDIELELIEVEYSKDRLVEYQKMIISLDENLKRCYRRLCDFYGKCKVLHCETSGGYSLGMLQSPTVSVCASLSVLLQCPAVQALCEQHELAFMRSQLSQIERVKWSSIQQSSDIDDLI